MSDTEFEGIVASPWSGGASPFAINSKKLGMWLFIISDSLTFSALLISYAYVRLETPNWPRPFEIWPAIAKSSLMTFVLLSSSLTMVLGVNSAFNGERRKTVRYLIATIICGIAFVAIHATEWVTLLGEHVTPWSNPFNPAAPLFGGTFFGLTGLHACHVFIGLLILLCMTIRSFRGHFSPEAHEGLEVGGIYWHFVDVMWIVVYVTVYLL